MPATSPNLLAIDPGPVKSAYVARSAGVIKNFGIVDNADLLHVVRDASFWMNLLVIEQIASYGMAVGQTVFETCYWSGRFAEKWLQSGIEENTVVRIPRKEICVHLCGSARAKDANIRQACIDRVGPAGTKREPGPTYGIAKDCWAALAVSLVAEDRVRAGII